MNHLQGEETNLLPSEQPQQPKLRVYSWRKQPLLVDPDTLRAHQESEPRLEHTSIPQVHGKIYEKEEQSLDVPIALQKGVRSCTKHPISNHVSYHRLSSKFCAFVTHISNEKEVPKNISEALANPNWIKAVIEEIRALQKNETCRIVNLQVGKCPVGCKWIFTIKYNSNGKVERYKARLVAKGFT